MRQEQNNRATVRRTFRSSFEKPEAVGQTDPSTSEGSRVQDGSVGIIEEELHFFSPAHPLEDIISSVLLSKRHEGGRT